MDGSLVPRCFDGYCVRLGVVWGTVSGSADYLKGLSLRVSVARFRVKLFSSISYSDTLPPACYRVPLRHSSRDSVSLRPRDFSYSSILSSHQLHTDMSLPKDFLWGFATAAYVSPRLPVLEKPSRTRDSAGTGPSPCFCLPPRTSRFSAVPSNHLHCRPPLPSSHLHSPSTHTPRSARYLRPPS